MNIQIMMTTRVAPNDLDHQFAKLGDSLMYRSCLFCDLVGPGLLPTGPIWGD